MRNIRALCLLTVCLGSGGLGRSADAAEHLSFALSGSSSAELLAWASKAGIDSSKLASGDELAVRGLLSQQDTTPGSVVVTMTRENSLAVINKQKTPFPDLVPAEAWDACSQHMQVALLLLQEVKQGPASKFDPWIQTLPTTFDSLQYWSKAEMDELQTGTMPGEQLKAQVCNIRSRNLWSSNSSQT